MSTPVWKTLAFWKAVSFLAAGVVGLLVLFGVIPAEWGVDSAVILSVILGILQLFGINPEIRARNARK